MINRMINCNRYTNDNIMIHHFLYTRCKLLFTYTWIKYLSLLFTYFIIKQINVYFIKISSKVILISALSFDYARLWDVPSVPYDRNSVRDLTTGTAEIFCYACISEKVYWNNSNTEFQYIKQILFVYSYSALNCYWAY